jgi:hypothetical protein
MKPKPGVYLSFDSIKRMKIEGDLLRDCIEAGDVELFGKLLADVKRINFNRESASILEYVCKCRPPLRNELMQTIQMECGFQSDKKAFLTVLSYGCIEWADVILREHQQAGTEKAALKSATKIEFLLECFSKGGQAVDWLEKKTNVLPPKDARGLVMLLWGAMQSKRVDWYDRFIEHFIQGRNEVFEKLKKHNKGGDINASDPDFSWFFEHTKHSDSSLLTACLIQGEYERAEQLLSTVGYKIDLDGFDSTKSEFKYAILAGLGERDLQWLIDHGASPFLACEEIENERGWSDREPRTTPIRREEVEEWWSVTEMNRQNAKTSDTSGGYGWFNCDYNLKVAIQRGNAQAVKFLKDVGLSEKRLGLSAKDMSTFELLYLNSAYRPDDTIKTKRNVL